MHPTPRIMKLLPNQRLLIDVHVVRLPEGPHDDITEATEDACNKTRDFYCQIQGDGPGEIAALFLNMIEKH